jgi:arginine:ornithine antiporter/lysine permease
MMSAEVLYVAAKDRDMPSFLARTTGKNVPLPALIMTSILIQVALVITLFSADAFTFTLKLCSSLSLIPYLLAAAYALKLGVRGETYDAQPQNRVREAWWPAWPPSTRCSWSSPRAWTSRCCPSSSTRQGRSCSS